MRITTSTEINAPAATVWACIDEPDNILRWVEGAVEHRYITPRENGHEVGQRLVGLDPDAIPQPQELRVAAGGLGEARQAERTEHQRQHQDNSH